MRLQSGQQGFQHLRRERAGEAELSGSFAFHYRSQCAEIAITHVEHEGGGTTDDARIDQLPALAVAFVAVIAGTGLAAQHDGPAGRILEGAGQPAGGPAFDDVGQRAPHGLCHFNRQQAFALGRFPGQAGVVGRAGRKVHAGEARGRSTHAIVDQNAHQFGQRGGPVARGADGGGIRRGDVVERIAQPFPVA